ncbi:4'-phosphopantetheinyl transferase superfamily protein [Parasedimentitalea maritima]|uniref:Enterobactin synthase component D n=1 Tax=Parasedimentitalea maritima TaxID=2578117 RepID=A0ABY2UXH1_9RHOB|nr:4'-phosphopantetheinyl transferase superfamily protein [Zongyanglinia marina]TLP67333.1 4'-phosphopantetheinyl transferase superfamily protein [Zongyanglinia marina]
MITELTAQDTQRHALARVLFEEDVALAVYNPLANPPRPFSAELACLSPNAVEKRQREFAAGRAAAHAAMGDLGYPAQPVLVGDKRAPIWPKGLTGSITHTRSCAMAVLARSDNLRGLGIDVEEDTPLKNDLLPAICSEREQAWLKSQSNPGQLAKVIFSAKEAAYKCQYTLSQRFFGFDGMELELDLAQGRFQARLTAEQPPFARGATFDGQFAVGAGVIVTAAELRN